MYLTVFKTSVNTHEQSLKIQLLLSGLPSTSACNFDLDDSDNILRLISTDSEPHRVCQLLQREGYHCETMETFNYQYG
ncbi:hypothetical protein IWX76_000407 [Pedobacter sp. CAN_A7]